MQPHGCIIRACKSSLDYMDGGACVKPKIMRTIPREDYAPIVTC